MINLNKIMLCLSLMLISCGGKIDELDSILSNLETKLTVEELNFLKEKKGKEIIDYVNGEDFLFSMTEGSVYNRVAPKLHLLLKEKGITSGRFDIYVVFIAIHYRLNGIEPIPYEAINDILISYYDEVAKSDQRWREETVKNAQLNFEKFEINDKLCFLYSIGRTVEDNQAVTYKKHKVLVDTLRLEGVLDEKYIKEFKGSEFLTYFFDVKILSINGNDDFPNTLGLLKNDKILNLNLNNFFSPIEGCK